MEAEGAGEAEVVAAFEDEGWALSDEVLRGVYAMGFERPSRIQGQTIGAMLAGRDVLGQAPSGAGKSGAFLIGVLETAWRRRREGADGPTALVVAHTRELARQTHAVATDLAQYTTLRIALVTGGEAAHAAGACDVVVGTPGKLEALSAGATPRLRLAAVATVVVDEVDEMFRQSGRNSCLEATRNLLGRVRGDGQVALFSATVSADVRNIAGELLREPLRVEVEAQRLALDGIQQYWREADASTVVPLVLDTLASVCSAQTMVFCGTGDEAVALAGALAEHQVPAIALHGKMGAPQRVEAMARFRGGAAAVMVSTPLLARGVDVQQVSLVILAAVPATPETYLHSVGRCGRYGRKGVAVALARAYDMATIRAVERNYGCTVIPWDAKK